MPWSSSFIRTPRAGSEYSILWLTYITGSILAHSQASDGVCHFQSFICSIFMLNNMPIVCSEKSNIEKLGTGCYFDVMKHDYWATSVWSVFFSPNYYTREYLTGATCEKLLVFYIPKWTGKGNPNRCALYYENDFYKTKLRFQSSIQLW